MKKYLILFACCFFTAKSFCQVPLELFNKKITLTLPAGLQSTGDIKENNIYVFADKNKTIKFNITQSGDEMDDNGIPAYTDAAIAAVKEESGSGIYDDGISLNSGKNIGYIKYHTGEKNTKMFNLVFYGSLDNKLVTFYFACKDEDKKKWEAEMDKVVAGVRIRDIERE